MIYNLRSIASSILAAVLVAHAAAVPSPEERSLGTLVYLKVQGLSETVFHGPVFTNGHNVTTESGAVAQLPHWFAMLILYLLGMNTGGTHHCDGTNNNAHPHSGPTATGALDSASKLRHLGFTFDGTFYSSFDDFFITTIGADTGSDAYYWALYVNGQYAQVGGCQQRVKLGDYVLWEYTAL